MKVSFLSLALGVALLAPLVHADVPPSATPNVSPAARAVLELFYAQKGQGPLIGQQAGDCYKTPVHDDPEWSGFFQKYVVDLQAASGQWPAMIEISATSDFKDLVCDQAEGLTPISTFLIDYWKDGGIPGMHLLFRNPSGGPPRRRDFLDRTDASKDWPDLQATVTPGTPENAIFHADVEGVADIIEKLERAGVPIVFRPLHEMNGNWFWYGGAHPTNKADPEKKAFKALWQYVYHHLTEVRGLTNIVWSFGPSSNDASLAMDFYPGDDRVDIVGFSLYDSEPRRSEMGDLDRMLATGKPIGLTECGPFPDDLSLDNVLKGYNERLLQFLVDEFPEATFFTRWARKQSIIFTAQVDGDPTDAVTFMNHPRFTSRGELVERHPLRVAPAATAPESTE